MIRLEGEFETGVYLRRLNRFMTEVEVNGNKVLAHLPNSGRLLTVLVPESKVFLRRQPQQRRKSNYDLFAIERPGATVIVDTRFSTLAAETAIQKGLFKSLAGYRVAKENVRVDNSLLDLLLKKGSHLFFLEIKCVTHLTDGVAMFPDAPTIRGRKHLETLMKLVQQGFGAGILFSVQRPNANMIKPYRKIDPAFSELLKKADETGVKILTQKLILRHPDGVEIQPNAPVFQF